MTETWIADDMLQASGLQALDTSAAEFLFGFAQCLRQHFVLPSLVLAYSWIDAMGALSSATGRANKKHFEWWLATYSATETASLGLTPADLYGARCGVLHTLSPSSDMSRDGKAKSIGYATGKADPRRYNEVAQSKGWPARMVHLEDIGRVAFNGTNRFFRRIREDGEVKARVTDVVKAGFFTEIGKEAADAKFEQLRQSTELLESLRAHLGRSNAR